MTRALLLFVALLAPSVWAQDLTFQLTSDPDYVRYLRANDAAFSAQISGDDAPASSRARAGRALVQVALIHTTTDSLIGTLIPLFESEIEQLQTIYERDFEGLDFRDAEQLARTMLDLTAGERYRALEADANRLASGFDEHSSETQTLVMNWAGGLARYAQTFAGDLEALSLESSPFSVSFRIEDSGAGTLVFDRNAITGALDAAADFEEVGFELIATIEQIAALAEDRRSPASSLAQIRALLLSVERSARSLDEALNAQPLSAFELAITGERAELGQAFDEVRAALDGRSYLLSDGVTLIRPVALIEQLDGGLYPLVLDFFRQPAAARSTYTFGNLLPAGLPSDVSDLLGVDASLSVASGSDVLRARVQVLERDFRSRIANASTFDAHAGLAMALAFQVFDDNASALEDAVSLLAKGDFETLLERHADAATGAVSRADAIAEQFQRALDAADGYEAFVFSLRVDEGGDPNAVADGDFVPVVVTTGMVEAIALAVDGLARSADRAAGEVTYLLDEADTGFDTYLDPNRLDFSNADTPFRVVAALQRANPDFLALTPLGRDRMLEAGDALRDVMPELSDAADDVLAALRDAAVLETLLGDGHVDLMGLLDDVQTYVHATRDDFVLPGTATAIEGEMVDLSAWFEVPPMRVLDAARLFFDGDDRTDNTFAGLFPSRTVSAESGAELEGPIAIERIAPHPARTEAHISFVIGAAGLVGAEVYDLLGRRVAVVDARPFGAGAHALTLPTNALSSGTYVLRLHADGVVTSRPLMVAR